MMPATVHPASAGTDDDARLIERLRLGDETAFETLYHRHSPVMLRFARRMGASRSTAEDVVHDVFMALLRQLHRYDPNRGPLTAYLFTILRRHVWRLRTRAETSDPPPSAAKEATRIDSDPHATAARAETVRFVRDAVKRLPFEYREAVVLCDLEGFDYQTAAQIIGRPIGTIRSRLFRGRRLLLEALAPAFIGSERRQRWGG